jgi:hypothetical protein
MSLLERVRPSWSATGDTQERTSAYLLGAFSGLRAAGISLGIVAVPLLAVWATAAHVTASWTQALRISASGWLLLQHVAIAYPGGHLALAPLGLTLVPGLAIYRSARRLAGEPLLSQGFSSTNSNPRPAVEALTGLTVAYAGCAVLVAAASWSTAVHPVLWQAPLGPAVLAAMAGAAGLLRGHPHAAALRSRVFGWLPERLRAVIRPAVVATFLVFGLSLAGVLVELVQNAGRVEALHRALDPGTFGGSVLVLGQVGYLPDLAAWGVAWLAGPGFAVGSGTLISATTVRLGVLPVIPVFGALPSSPVPGGWLLMAAFAGPVLAGGWCGWRTVRRAAVDDLGLVSRLLDALLGAVLAAVLLGLLVALSTGAIGPGRLAEVGANALVVTPFLAVELALGALPVAAVATWWRRRRPSSAHDEPATQLVEPAVEL